MHFSNFAFVATIANGINAMTIDPFFSQSNAIARRQTSRQQIVQRQSRYSTLGKRLASATVSACGATEAGQAFEIHFTNRVANVVTNNQIMGDRRTSNPVTAAKYILDAQCRLTLAGTGIRATVSTSTTRDRIKFVSNYDTLVQSGQASYVECAISGNLLSCHYATNSGLGTFYECNADDQESLIYVSLGSTTDSTCTAGNMFLTYLPPTPTCQATTEPFTLAFTDATGGVGQIIQRDGGNNSPKVVKRTVGNDAAASQFMLTSDCRLVTTFGNTPLYASVDGYDFANINFRQIDPQSTFVYCNIIGGNLSCYVQDNVTANTICIFDFFGTSLLGIPQSSYQISKCTPTTVQAVTQDP